MKLGIDDWLIISALVSYWIRICSHATKQLQVWAYGMLIAQYLGIDIAFIYLISISLT